MRFTLIDRLVEWHPQKSLKAVKYLTLGEEYLADHFPKFPVMPGVLMLQALVEASSWLWRISTDFESSLIVLREVKSVKYGTFMEPGKILELDVEWIREQEGRVTFKGKGNIEAGAVTVQAQFVLEAKNIKGSEVLTESENWVAEKNHNLKNHWRERFHWLSRGAKLSN